LISFSIQRLALNTLKVVLKCMGRRKLGVVRRTVELTPETVEMAEKLAEKLAERNVSRLIRDLIREKYEELFGKHSGGN